MRSLKVVALVGLMISLGAACSDNPSTPHDADTGMTDVGTHDTGSTQDSGELEDVGGGDIGRDTGVDSGSDAGADTGSDIGRDTGVNPTPVCGNGVIEGDEACDDNNTDDADGCSSSCQIEQGFSCTNAVNLNTGSDGQGGQLQPGATDPVWQWAQGTLEADGSTPATLPSDLNWRPTTVVHRCFDVWNDATAPAQWINSTGWDVTQDACSPHPTPLSASLRYYRATFHIPSEEAASSTALSGKMWADNQATRIFINGTEVTEYQRPAADGSSYRTADFVDFGTWGSGYYKAGQNEIVIAVKNLASPSAPNPEGLLVRVPDAFTSASTCTRVSTCGDGVIEGREECDDNNTDDADGCSSACKIEPGWACANAINLNTGSDGQGDQLQAGATDPIWQWAQGSLNSDGSTPTTLPSGLSWSPTTVIHKCAGAWTDATAPAQWINTTGWDATQNACSPHPTPLIASLRYYRATFDIASANAALATTLRGDLWADNQVTRIFINGSEVTEYTPPAPDGSSYQTADSVDFGTWGSSYYQAGHNEIVIAVKNLASPAPPNPEGLLVRVPDAFVVGSMCTQLP